MTYSLAPSQPDSGCYVVLDTGPTISVRTEIERVAGNSLAIKAFATDTVTGIQTASAHTFSAQEAVSYGAPALAKEMLLLALGESPTLFGQPPLAGHPSLCAIDDGVLRAWSIRHALTLHAQTASLDLRAILN